jgi:hypothetical protein
MLPVSAAVILTVVVALTPPQVALIVTEPGLLSAEKVVVATPLTVEPCAFERFPKVVSLMMKFTSVPSGTDLLAPVTMAEIVDVPNTVVAGLFALRLTVSAGGAEIVIVVVPVRLRGAYETLTVTGVAILFAINVTEATPPASVATVTEEPVVVGPDKYAAAVLTTVKVTLRPSTGVKPLRSALIVVFPFVRIAEEAEDTAIVGTEATGLIVIFV